MKIIIDVAEAIQEKKKFCYAIKAIKITKKTYYSLMVEIAETSPEMRDKLPCRLFKVFEPNKVVGFLYGVPLITVDELEGGLPFEAVVVEEKVSAEEKYDYGAGELEDSIEYLVDLDEYKKCPQVIDFVRALRRNADCKDMLCSLILRLCEMKNAETPEGKDNGRE